MATKRLSRREFLKASSLTTAGVALASCAPAATQAPAVATQAGAAAATQVPAAASAAVIDLWSEFSAPPASDAMKLVVDAFNKDHKTVQIKHTAFENTPYKAALKAAIASGAPPDVAEDDTGGWLAPYVNANQLVDISDLFAGAESKFDPGTIDAVTYNGKQWAVPFTMDVGNLIWYNKDILAKYQIDPASLTKWSTLTAACDKLLAAGVTPFILGNKEGWNGAHWLGHLYIRTMGVAKALELFNRGMTPGFTTNLKFTDPMAVKPWQILKDMQDKGYFSKGILSDDFPTAYSKFFRGEGAFFQTGGWLLNTWKTQFKDFNAGFFLVPAMDDIPESDATDFVFNTIGMRIPREAKHIDAAKEVLKWYLSSETPHRLWAENNYGVLPAMKTITKLNGVPDEVNQFLALKNNAHHSTLFIDSKVDGDVSQSILWEASNGLFSGALTPQTAAENAEKVVTEWQNAHKK